MCLRSDLCKPCNYYWHFLHLQVLEHVEPLRPYESLDTLKQFLQYHGKILCFFCLWDDSVSMFGDRRELILHYFLCDDTIEIKELLPHNSGRDAIKMFLRRSKLPKVSSGHNHFLNLLVSQETRVTVWNVVCYDYVMIITMHWCRYLENFHFVLSINIHLWK